MSYDENEYWNNRLKTVGYLNNPNGTVLSWQEATYCQKYIFKNARILDYGAGDGKLMPLYQEYGCDVVFYDIAECWVNELKKRYISGQYNFNYQYVIQKAYTEYCTDKIFDLVFCTGVLAHIKPEHIEWTLREMKRIAGDGVAACVAHQNKENDCVYTDYCFNHDFEKIFAENNIPFKEYIYKEKIAYFTL